MNLKPAVFLSLVMSSAFGQTYTISTLAGGGLPVIVPGTSASLYGPQAVAVDKGGNVFLTDHNDVLRLDAQTGMLTLVAGNGTAGFSGDNGLPTNAQLSDPESVAVDSSGNLYIADAGNNRIRRVSNGVITTVAGGGTGSTLGDNAPATNALLSGPRGVAVDSAGNLYIADTGFSRIRKVSNRVITTVAGGAGLFNLAGFGGDNGPATSAQLSNPVGIAVDSTGTLYIADTGNSRVRKVSNGVITTLAGNGTQGFSGDGGLPTSAELSYPFGVILDSAGNLYIADSDNASIRKVSNGVITTVVGTGVAGVSGDGGLAASAQLAFPTCVALDSSGNLYIADNVYGGRFNSAPLPPNAVVSSQRVRKISGGVMTTVVGGGAANAARLNSPSGVTVDSAGNLYIADSTNNRITKVSNGVITTVAGNGTAGFSGDNGPATSAQLSIPGSVAVDSSGNLFIADTFNNRIRKVSNGVITTVAGNGTAGFGGDNGSATSAALNIPRNIAVDSSGNVYIADTGNFRIRKVTGGVINTVAGNGTSGSSGDNGPATSAQLGTLTTGLAVDSAGNLYLSDPTNARIREVSNGVITTVAGSGVGGFSGDSGPAISARLFNPEGIGVDSAGNLYIAENGDSRIRKVAEGTITTIAGAGPSFGDDGPGTSAEFSGPVGVAVDSSGNVYVADTGNNRIRILTPGTPPRITPGGIVPAGSSVPVIQPGSWISIYGSNLASGTYVWDGDFPTFLAGTSVMIDDRPGYLLFVSPSQINLQVPDDSSTGMVSVAVTTASGTATSTVTLAAYGPAFSLLGDGRHVAGQIATPDGSGAYGSGTYDLLGPVNTFSFDTRPVKPGETLVLYGTGFGPTTPRVSAGLAFSGAATTNSPVTVTIGGVTAKVSFAGITGAGLYQINLTVPQGVGSGDQPVQASLTGAQTPAGVVVDVQ